MAHTQFDLLLALAIVRSKPRGEDITDYVRRLAKAYNVNSTHLCGGQVTAQGARLQSSELLKLLQSRDVAEIPTEAVRGPDTVSEQPASPAKAKAPKKKKGARTASEAGSPSSQGASPRKKKKIALASTIPPKQTSTSNTADLGQALISPDKAAQPAALPAQVQRKRTALSVEELESFAEGRLLFDSVESLKRSLNGSIQSDKSEQIEACLVAMERAIPACCLFFTSVETSLRVAVLEYVGMELPLLVAEVSNVVQLKSENATVVQNALQQVFERLLNLLLSRVRGEEGAGIIAKALKTAVLACISTTKKLQPFATFREFILKRVLRRIGQIVRQLVIEEELCKSGQGEALDKECEMLVSTLGEAMPKSKQQLTMPDSFDSAQEGVEAKTVYQDPGIEIARVQHIFIEAVLDEAVAAEVLEEVVGSMEEDIKTMGFSSGVLKDNLQGLRSRSQDFLGSLWSLLRFDAT